MGNEDFSDLDYVKRLTTFNMAEDIRTWLRQEQTREREDFAELAKISVRTLDSILAYDGTGEEPNWTRKTMEGIMRALGRCEPYYTPPHDIK